MIYHLRLSELSIYDSNPHKPNTIGVDEFRAVMREHFPFEVIVKGDYRFNSSLAKFWLALHMGQNNQRCVMLPGKEMIADELNTQTRWCFERGCIFRFKSRDDALLFKLSYEAP